MTSKLTREEMQELISALRLTPTSTVNGISLGRLADALSEKEAAMGSEPIGFRCRRNDGLGDWFHVYHRTPDEFERKHLLIENIYTSPQPAPVVPDERKSFESFMAERFGDSVDQRRAKNGDQGYMAWDMVVAWIVWQARATLQAGNSPVIPDRWIPVSERMPEEGQHIIIFCDDAFVLSAQHRDGEFFDVVRDGDEFFETTSRCVTHWMPLPAAPQEVVIANRPG